MAHPHPVVSFPHPGSPAPQHSVHANVFPNIPVSENSNQPPLDLNFSQKVLQNPVKSDLENVQVKEPEPVVTSQQEILPTSVADGTTSNGGTDSPSKAPAERTPKNAARGSASQKSRCHWTHGEIIALFDAKKAQAERADFGSRRLKSSTSGKWDDIAEFCRSMGVKKQPSQCRDKWERLWPTFRKILEWERQIPEGKSSYWVMTEDERDQEGFPRVFDKELYDAMFARFGFVNSLNMSALAVSSPIEDSADVQEPVQNGVAILEDGPSVVDDHTPVSSGRKRKQPPRSCTLKKTPEDSKKVCVVSDAHEDTHPTRTSRDAQTKSNKPLDINDRRLLLEERKIKLAERRFFLEEKKLEATIEIGKGLIASMERMTSMISSLGSSAAPR